MNMMDSFMPVLSTQPPVNKGLTKLIFCGCNKPKCNSTLCKCYGIVYLVLKLVYAWETKCQNAAKVQLLMIQVVMMNVKIMMTNVSLFTR